MPLVIGFSFLPFFFNQGITFKDYLAFFSFMRNISEADMALSFHNAAGKAIDPGLFRAHYL